MAGNTEADRMTARRAGLRVSDAERDAMAGELAEHLQDGRLDTAEFDERVGQAVTAKTRGDGLADALVELGGVQPPVLQVLGELAGHRVRSASDTRRPARRADLGLLRCSPLDYASSRAAAIGCRDLKPIINDNNLTRKHLFL